MNKIILRFIIVKKQKTLEVIFDGRLTMEENFKLLSEIYEIDPINKTYVVDINRKVALKKDIPISSFNFKNFKTLYLF
ncbi:MAG: hypothetical protein PUD31_06345 [Solobacterium sp.]|nr:hypothetical protein [Solobacterium sp.]MDY2952861.1 hypothetical protein [Erysipelotrichaceae bacterium]MCI6697268.1 hypothetical protein [Solobacterium sp.]MCI6845615.1 hypothetical protein [Solobacterium sp.]MCI6878689.1 hypothetical protein [Solobacterium sp.]